MVAISVLIPTYDRRQLVLRAIESVLDQQHPPVDIVVVDDGSTDGTAEAVAALGLERVTVLQQANRGPSAARNLGVAACRGDVIAFLDSDNTWFPHHLSTLANLFERHPDAVLAGTQRMYRFGDESTADAEARDMIEGLVLDLDGVGVLSSVGIRRAALLASGGFDEDLWYGEDNDLFLRLALLGPFTCISARTVNVAADPDGLRQRGERTGGYTPLLGTSAENLLRALAASNRSDAHELRRLARARAAFGRALVGLQEGEAIDVLRECFDEMLSYLPRRLPGEAWWVSMHLARVAGWRDPGGELAIRRRAARAWPRRGRTRAELHACVVEAAIRQRRYLTAARAAAHLATPSGAMVLVRAVDSRRAAWADRTWRA